MQNGRYGVTDGGRRNSRWIIWTAAGCATVLLCVCVLAAIGGGAANIAGLFDDLLTVELAAGSPPLFGEVILEPGFSPAPFTRQVSVEGDVDVSFTPDLPAECTGNVTESPTLHMQWSGETEEVDIAFNVDTGGDAVMVVRDPAGNWHCNDDFNGLDPAVALFNPASGGYDIWIGTYTGGGTVTGNLVIAEPAVSTVENERLNPEETPLFGTDELSAGFSPDPYTTTLDAGGPVHIGRAMAAASVAGSAAVVAGQCVGQTTAAPGFRLFWSGQAQDLRLFFVSLSAADDPTLVVLDPAGEWHCNDDDQSTDPLVQISNPEEGAYYIWVGTYSAGDLAPGILYVTQQAMTVLDVVPGAIVTGTGELDLFALPTYGGESLAAGFAPQPFIMDVVSGGNVDVNYLSLGFDCTGYVSSPPDFRLEWSGATESLFISFTGDEAGDDGTLVIRDPAGEYHCNDDADDLDPLVEIENPPAGEFLIWIGSYNGGDFLSGSLAIYE